MIMGISRVYVLRTTHDHDRSAWAPPGYSGRMAILHRTTMTPTKLELLTDWLPGRPWYRGGAGAPRLVKVGGFRLDDPEGEVGIEFMAVADTHDGQVVTYHAPMTYRGAPLEGAQDALIGVSEHGVLGTRWIYDGTRDPVLAGQLVALLAGRAVAQMQSVNDTPDPGVAAQLAGPAPSADPGLTKVADSPEATDIRLRSGASGEQVVRVNRVLLPGTAEPAGLGYVTADWMAPDGTKARGRYVVVVAG